MVPQQTTEVAWPGTCPMPKNGKNQKCWVVDYTFIGFSLSDEVSVGACAHKKIWNMSRIPGEKGQCKNWHEVKNVPVPQDEADTEKIAFISWWNHARRQSKRNTCCLNERESEKSKAASHLYCMLIVWSKHSAKGLLSQYVSAHIACESALLLRCPWHSIGPVKLSVASCQSGRLPDEI